MSVLQPGLCCCAAATLMVLTGGCQAPSADGDRDLIVDQAQRDAAMDRLFNAEHGLEVRTWVVLNDVARLSRALGQFSADVPIEADHAQTLRQGGFRLFRIPSDAIAALRSSVGVITAEWSSWHGQSLDWRALHAMPIPPGGASVAMSGRPQSFDGESLRLMLRTWTVPMEDGPVVHFQFAPQHLYPRRPDLSRLLPTRQVEEPVDWLPDLEFDLSMERGFAYVLTCADPEEDWSQAVADAPPVESIEQVAAAQSAADSANSTGAEGNAEDEMANADVSASEDETAIAEPGVGPAIEAPLTLGQWLMTRRSSPRSRTIFVFVPKLPDRLFPPELRDQPPAEQVSMRSQR